MTKDWAAIKALNDAYDSLAAEAVKMNEGPNGPLRLQCKQIEDQIKKLKNSGTFDVTIQTPDLPKTAEAWQLWKVILACTVALPVGFVMLLVMWVIVSPKTPTPSQAQYARDKRAWDQAMAVCELQNSKISYYEVSNFCENKLLANGLTKP